MSRTLRVAGGMALAPLALACGLLLGSDRPSSGRDLQGGEVVSRERTGGREVIRFRWEDANTERVVGREGDTLIVDPEGAPVALSHDVEIDLARLDAVISSFGVPESWLGFSYRGESERRQKERERGRRLASRGFTISDNVARVDPAWVVAESREDMRPLATGLGELARKHDYSDLRGYLGVVVSLVQSLEYRIPPARRRLADGGVVFTGGVTLPLETLHVAAGDCDTKCLLLASVLANVQGAGVILLEGNDHMFAGLRGAPRKYDRYVRVQGLTYVLVELTSPWPMGMLPAEHWTGIRANRFRVIPVLPQR